MHISNDFESLSPTDAATVASELRRAFYKQEISDGSMLETIRKKTKTSTVLTAWFSRSKGEKEFAGVAILTPMMTMTSNRVLFASDACVPARHRRKGVARTLAMAAIAHASKSSCDEIRAVFSEDAPAGLLLFYESLGFLKTNDARNEYSLFVPSP